MMTNSTGTGKGKGRLTVFNLSIFKPCQSYLCPFENRIQEWFPTMESAKFRYGNMVCGVFKQGVLD